MKLSAYSDRILRYIDAESEYFTPLTAKKFAKAGEYFADLAEVLDYSSQRWLNDWLNESYGENEYCEVDHDWGDWLHSRTQQSVSVAFLEKYQKSDRSGNNYPQTRETWSKEFVPNAEPEIDLAGAIATAHAEDITLWSNLIDAAIATSNSITFTQLTQTLDLTPAQIYLGIVLSDRFTIIKDNESNFYSGFSVSLASTTHS
ncbi:MAG: hypothetical protein AAFR63_16925 [Cyanobacteria bacterium J06631_6]